MAFFKIDGSHLTGLARARVIEDRFDHGFRMLHDGLIGITADQVLSILRGDHKLVGINDMDMAEDDDKVWKAQLQNRFAGVWVTSGGRFLRPYAAVTSWGPDDMAYADKITIDSDSVYSRRITGGELGGRDLYYADDHKRDARKDLQVSSDVMPEAARDKFGCISILFREVQSFPVILVNAHHSAQKALDAFLAAGLRLQERGYVQTFPPKNFKVRYDCETKTDPAPIARTHVDISEQSQTDFHEIGRFRNKVMDAKTRKMTLDEYEEYQRLMADNNSPLQKRVDAMNKALEIQRNLDQNISAWREQIVAQAGDNWLEMDFHGKAIRIPRAPFEQWCLWRGDGAHLAMPWQKVSVSGVKMFGDDPYHTDFLIGAGLEPDAMIKDSKLSEAFFDLRAKVQEEKMGFECAVLSGRGYVNGTIVHAEVGQELPDDAIVVVKAAKPDYIDMLVKARAIIVERGGQAAHLVQVAMEREAVIVRVPDALTRYPAGSLATIDASHGKVTLHEGNMKSIWDQI